MGSAAMNVPRQLVIGLLGGFLATLPMTIWMLAANRTLPAKRPDPLPPEEITDNLLRKADADDALSAPEKKKLSLVNHFLYGAAIGSPMGLINRAPISGSRAFSRGMLYGIGVWLSNYLGLLPSLRLYPPATREPARMNGIMIIGHVIWGGSLGWLTRRLAKPLAK